MSSPASTSVRSALLVTLLVFWQGIFESEAFSIASSSSLSLSPRCRNQFSTTRLLGTFYNDFEGYNVQDDDDNEDDDDDDEDEFLLVDDRDWRTFRKNLSIKEQGQKKKPTSVSVENEEVLESQSKVLYKEYKQGIWAHETPVVCRLKDRKKGLYMATITAFSMIIFFACFA